MKGERTYMNMDDVTAHNKRELEYINFFCSFLLFLTKAFDTLFTQELLSVEKSNRMERNIMTSVSLLWTLHVSIFSKKMLYNISPHDKMTSQTFDEKHSNTILPLITQLKKKVNKYPFINENQKIQCLNTLEQIQLFYTNPPDIPTIVVSNLHAPPPWLSKEVFINGS